MKCPYAVDRHSTTQTTFEYDESGNLMFQQSIEHNSASFVDCLQENCGAWQNGKCQYNQVD